MDRYLLKPIDRTAGGADRKVKHAKSDSSLPAVGIGGDDVSCDRSWSHGNATGLRHQDGAEDDEESAVSPFRRLGPIAIRRSADDRMGTSANGSENVVRLPSINEPRLVRHGPRRRPSVVDGSRPTAASYKIAGTGYVSDSA